MYLSNYTGPAVVQKITITGKQLLTGNKGDGLTVYSQGAISVTSVTATGNGVHGVSLWNSYSIATGGITLGGASVLSGNLAGHGAYITSNGPISISSVTADSNFYHGISADNINAATPQNLAISGVNQTNDNGIYGVYAVSDGLITINSLTAKWNGNTGLYAYNDYAAATAGITLTGTNAFVDNEGTADGMYARSNGTVTVYNVTADRNMGDGLDIVTAGAITVCRGYTSGNAQYGLRLTAGTTITLKGVWSAANGSPTDLFSPPTVIRYRACP